MPTDKQRNNAFKKTRTAQLRVGLKIRKDTYGEIVKLLKGAEKNLVQALRTAPTDYQAFYLPQVQAEIRNALKRVEAASAGMVGQAMDKSWQAGIDLVDEPIAAGGVQIRGILPAIDTRQLVAMRNFTVDRMRDVSQALANRISAELGLAMIGSQNLGDTVSNIQRLFGKQGRSRALTVTRTELGRAYAVATQKRLAAAQAHLPGLKKQWRRSGKTHSRHNHDLADGQIVGADEKYELITRHGEVIKIDHPRDPKAPKDETINCGCESLPYMESWEVKTPGAKPLSAQEQLRRQASSAAA